MLHSRIFRYSFFLVMLVISLACRQTAKPLAIPTIIYKSAPAIEHPAAEPTPINVASLPMIRQADDPTIATPTPDEQHDIPELRTEEESYVVQSGDSLGNIAAQYNITVQMLISRNQIFNPDLIEVGQQLYIPAPVPGEPGPGSKIIPDSELVYGPYAGSFDVGEFVAQYDSYLSRYYEIVEGKEFSGAGVVQFVAQDYSINPRLLLAILEYQSGWVTQANPVEETRVFPIGLKDNWRSGLYQQLAWAANYLNRGYYLWKVNGINGWLLSSGEMIPVDPTINAGTAGVQQLFATLYDRQGWDRAVSPDGLYATYGKLFGYPFDYAVEPLIPENVEQPTMQLPFEQGVDWAFTGGPHGGWADGSSWSALDFAPGGDGRGCIQSDLWVVAVADGPVIRSDQGRVMQDLDEDGKEGTGWVVLYMHIEARDRVEAGAYLHAGDRIGHPSCEGGYSTGTHTHIARRYNGEWIPADQVDDRLAFVMDGWVSSGNGIEYDGYLERDGEYIEAWEGFYPGNTIHR